MFSIKLKCLERKKKTTWMPIWNNSDNKKNECEQRMRTVQFLPMWDWLMQNTQTSRIFWSARQLQITIFSDNWDRVLLRRVDISYCFSTNLETKCCFVFKLDATAYEQSIISSVTWSILVPREFVFFSHVVGETSTRFYWGRDWTHRVSSENQC